MGPANVSTFCSCCCVYPYEYSLAPGVGGSACVDGPQAASGLPAGQVSAAHIAGLLAMMFSMTSSSSSFGSLQHTLSSLYRQVRQCYILLALLVARQGSARAGTRAPSQCALAAWCFLGSPPPRLGDGGV